MAFRRACSRSLLSGLLYTAVNTRATVQLFSIANGLCETAINPLVATMYADDKTRRLVALHAWFPGGIVIGGVLSFLFTQAAHYSPALAPYTGWQAKMLLLLVPSVWYGFLFAGQTFPSTERAAAGVPFSDMFKEILRPLFIVIWLLDNRPVGYSSCDKITFGERANMHLHVTVPELRGKGIGTECVRRSAEIYFRRFRLKQLFCQPSALNVPAHRTLQAAGFKYVKTYLTVPGAINFHQPVTQWVIDAPG